MVKENEKFDYLLCYENVIFNIPRYYYFFNILCPIIQTNEKRESQKNRHFRVLQNPYDENENK